MVTYFIKFCCIIMECLTCDGTKQLRYRLEPTARVKYFYRFDCMSTGDEKVVSILDIHLPKLELVNN